jgi:hypothetical protein
MSSKALAALLSATFWEPGYDHRIELVHQRGPGARRTLAALDVEAYDAEGHRLAHVPVDPRQEMLDLDAAMQAVGLGQTRTMVLLDARYDERVFPYRPHHYAFLHRHASTAPALYYAVNAVLGGVPDRIGAVGINNFESYLFRRDPFAARYSLLLGNVSRFVDAEAHVITYHGDARTSRDVRLGPKAHAEVELPAERDGTRLSRVEVKAVFRLASYVVARKAGSGELVLFDHLFAYNR